jgi:FkbM family methyltransferase
MIGVRRLTKDLLHRLGYSVRSHGANSSVNAIDIVADVKVLLGRPSSPLFFDVGANEGQTILEMTRDFPGATIHSFEPSPKTYRGLANQFGSRSNIKLHNLALGDQPGEFPFTVCSDWSVNDSLLNPAWSSLTNTVTVSVATLDQFCQQQAIERIDWLKIDTQGYDLRVLQGAQSLLASGRIHLVSAEAMFNQMYEGQPSLCDLLQFMAGCNYRVNGFYEQEYINNKLSYCNVLWAQGI